MNLIKSTIPKHNKSLIVISLLLLMSFSILSIRVVITKTTNYFFLIWNVFLACIPYLITIHLSNKKNLNKIGFVLLFASWLAFLPNAPYIITDLFHLKRSAYNIIWIDTLLITSFAATGILLFYFSLNLMKALLLDFFNKKVSEIIIIVTIFLSAFGVYIGRFLRYNSWEILSHPMPLIEDVFNMIYHPIVSIEVWLFTLAFGLFLVAGYYIINCFKLKSGLKY
ncbi:DUF1361 domain-containing protein [uncultured Lacinutrix sp.]|uniref:DUF1361 domain-containing protein n=1 Tax=uncultured Lacinutrix sp. TaxID=574032 RepID=UPI00261F95F6|nr:DUF1361 domain-containing protein [uncultured Lacinutrix sp.]